MILTQSFAPLRKLSAHFAQGLKPHRHFNAVPLPVVETHRFNVRKTLQRPGQARRRILSAGEEHERTPWLNRVRQNGFTTTRNTIANNANTGSSFITRK